MKKILLASIIGLMSITSSYAACNGGIEISNTAGTTFCKSNVPMNWWSAAAWCKANSLRLATMYEMCPNWDGSTGVGKCTEIDIGDSAYGDWTWSATASGNEYAFYVDPNSGTVKNDDYRDRKNYAICR